VIKDRPSGKPGQERPGEKREAGKNNFTAGRFRFKLYLEQPEKWKI